MAGLTDFPIVPPIKPSTCAFFCERYATRRARWGVESFATYNPFTIQYLSLISALLVEHSYRSPVGQRYALVAPPLVFGRRWNSVCCRRRFPQLQQAPKSIVRRFIKPASLVLDAPMDIEIDLNRSEGQHARNSSTTPGVVEVGEEMPLVKRQKRGRVCAGPTAHARTAAAFHLKGWTPNRALWHAALRRVGLVVIQEIVEALAMPFPRTDGESVPDDVKRIACGQCNGRGIFRSGPCHVCRGRGWMEVIEGEPTKKHLGKRARGAKPPPNLSRP